MREEAKAAGARFWIATLTAPVQVYPDRGLRREFAQALGVSDLDYPDRRIDAFARRSAIPAISLLDPLRAYVDRNGAYLHGFDNTRLGTGHWNETGHRLAADNISRKLCAAD